MIFFVVASSVKKANQHQCTSKQHILCLARVLCQRGVSSPISGEHFRKGKSARGRERCNGVKKKKVVRHARESEQYKGPPAPKQRRKRRTCSPSSRLPRDTPVLFSDTWKQQFPSDILGPSPTARRELLSILHEISKIEAASPELEMAPHCVSA